MSDLNNIKLSRARTIVSESIDLLIDVGTMRERLLKAAQCFIALNRSDLEGFPELQKQYDEIYSALTAKQDATYGAYDASVRSMSSPKMRATSQSLVDFERSIRAQK